jgi:hypothetical protein
MRNGALLLALVFAVASVTTADAAKKRRAGTMADPAVQSQQDSANFMNDLFHPWAPATPEPKMRKVKKKKK